MDKINLDVTDRKILAELDKNCRISDTALAKKFRKSREAVKYRIKQLQKKGIIINFVTSINATKLGYNIFKVYLKLKNIPDKKEQFFEFLKHDKSIYWVGISNGAFDCVFAVLSRSAAEFFDNINFILSKWDYLVLSKVLGILVDSRGYNKKFFTNDRTGSFVIFGGDVVKNDVDNLDFSIINILANDARIPLVELAKRTKSTVEIVRRRIRIMEEKGIILNYRLAVDYNKLGLDFFKALVYFRTLSREDEIVIFEWMRTAPNALYCVRSLAPWEFELEFVVESYSQFNSIMNDLMKKFPRIIRNHEHLIIVQETLMPAYKELPAVEQSFQ